MLKRRVGIALCLLAVASFLIPSMAVADSWYVCTVSYVGKNANGELVFRLTEVGGRFTSQLCKIVDPTQANHYMAILVTAQVMGSDVGVCTQNVIPVGGGGTAMATCLYLQQ